MKPYRFYREVTNQQSATISTLPGRPATVEAIRVAELTSRYGAMQGAELLGSLRQETFPGRLALVSSFGAESAVLLAMAAEADAAFPVLFVNTGKMFGETLRYRDRLVSHLGLSNVQTIGPTQDEIVSGDADGMLFNRSHDACCTLRKAVPLARALEPFDAWVTGRKQFQSSTRAALPLFEFDGDKYKINPLASFNKEQLEAEFARRNLPRHPLEADGFLSIGCFTCTERVAPGADPRSGRWAGSAKVECGIHVRKVAAG